MHSGDERTGESMHDDEAVTLDFGKLAKDVRVLTAVVSSYNGDPLAPSTLLRLGSLGHVAVAGAGTDATASVVVHIYRTKAGGSEWEAVIVNEAAKGRCFADVVPALQRALMPAVLPSGSVRVSTTQQYAVLQKGEIVRIKSTSAVTLGLGWDMRPGGGAIDLDASAVQYNAAGDVLDIVSFGKLRSSDGCVRHSGDNLTGEGDGDDERIFVDLQNLPQRVTDIIFVVNAYNNDPLRLVQNAYVRVIDQGRHRELLRYTTTGTGKEPNTALVVCKLTRGKDNSEWTCKAVGNLGFGNVVRNCLDLMSGAVKGHVIPSAPTRNSSLTATATASAAGGEKKPNFAVLILLLVVAVWIYNNVVAPSQQTMAGGRHR